MEVSSSGFVVQNPGERLTLTTGSAWFLDDFTLGFLVTDRFWFTFQCRNHIPTTSHRFLSIRAAHVWWKSSQPPKLWVAINLISMTHPTISFTCFSSLNPQCLAQGAGTTRFKFLHLFRHLPEFAGVPLSIEGFFLVENWKIVLWRLSRFLMHSQKYLSLGGNRQTIVQMEVADWVWRHKMGYKWVHTLNMFYLTIEFLVDKFWANPPDKNGDVTGRNRYGGQE